MCLNDVRIRTPTNYCLLILVILGKSDEYTICPRDDDPAAPMDRKACPLETRLFGCANGSSMRSHSEPEPEPEYAPPSDDSRPAPPLRSVTDRGLPRVPEDVSAGTGLKFPRREVDRDAVDAGLRAPQREGARVEFDDVGLGAPRLSDLRYAAAKGVRTSGACASSSGWSENGLVACTLRAREPERERALCGSISVCTRDALGMEDMSNWLPFSWMVVSVSAYGRRALYGYCVVRPVRSS